MKTREDAQPVETTELKPPTDPEVESVSAAILIPSFIFPVLSGFLATSGAFICIGTAINLNHTEPLSSFVSDGGALQPESCIFSLLFTSAGFFWFITLGVRIFELWLHMDTFKDTKITVRIILYLLTFFGVLSGVGLVMVGNFPEGTKVAVIHTWSASLSFFSGMLFAWTYIALSFILKPRFTKLYLTIPRIVLASIATVSLAVHEALLHLPSKPLVPRNENGTHVPKPERGRHSGIRRIGTEHPYFLNQAFAAASEWTMCIAFFLLLATIGFDMHSIEVTTTLHAFRAEENDRKKSDK